MTRRFVACGFLVALSTGCDSGDADPSAFTLVDSAGIEIVVNHEPEWEEGEGWTITGAPLVTIGSVDGGSRATLFSWVSGATRLSDGRIVVLDSEASEVRWFGAGGEHLKTMGGKGQGPGEFNYASALFRMGGDTVLVEDRPRIKHVLFDRSGELAGTEVLDYDGLTEMGPWVECMSRTLPDRSVMMCKPEAGEPERRPDPGPGHLRSYSRFVRLPFDLSSIDTLGLYAGIEQWGIRHGGRTRFAVHPFHSRTRVAARRDPLRIAIARNPEYSVEVWSDSGLTRVVRRSDAVREPSLDERELAAEQMAVYARGDDALAARFRDEIPTPDSLPAVQDLVMTETGELLVRRTLLLTDSGIAEWDVFDPDGRWLGTIELPDRLSIQEIGRDYILGVRLDAMDVPHVEMYGLERDGGGG